MSNCNDVCIAVFLKLFIGVSQKSHTPPIWCPTQRYMLCSACVCWCFHLVCVPVFWLPAVPSCCGFWLQLSISQQQGTRKCFSIPSDVHHNCIYGSIPGFVSIALTSLLYLWNPCSVQWEGFWQLHLDLSGNITFIWRYRCFGICSSPCNRAKRLQ